MARFIVANRLAGTASRTQAARDTLHANFFAAHDNIRGFANIVSPPEERDSSRRMMIVDADAVELNAKRAEFSPDVIIEPEMLRSWRPPFGIGHNAPVERFS